MRIVIFAVGSRGDVQPALALAWHLGQLRHKAVVAVPADLVEFARTAGVDARPVSVNAREFLESPEGRQWLAAGKSREYLRGLMSEKRRIAKALQADMTEVAQGADVIVATRLVEEEASSLAESLRIPFVGLHYAPVRRNGRFPAILVTNRSLPRSLNLVTHTLFTRTEWRHNAPDTNVFRSSLGLPATDQPVSVRLAAAGSPEVQAYSRHLVPELSDWELRRPLVGQLRMPTAQRDLIGAEQVDPPLSRWLDDGDPPVYFGFGGMPVAGGAAVLSMIRESTRALGLRALVSAGWSDIPAEAADDDRVRLIASVNHDEVLPRCLMAVHHGGAGSTSASLSAGLPTVVCSVIADQPFWGRRVRRLGVGDTFRFTDLDSGRLTSALAGLLNDGPAKQAAALGQRLVEESAEAAAHTARIIEVATADWA